MAYAIRTSTSQRTCNVLATRTHDDGGVKAQWLGFFHVRTRLQLVAGVIVHLRGGFALLCTRTF